jgi:hypothetical protein
MNGKQKSNLNSVTRIDNATLRYQSYFFDSSAIPLYCLLKAEIPRCHDGNNQHKKLLAGWIKLIDFTSLMIRAFTSAVVPTHISN